MTVVFPVCAKDSEALLRLLDWCRDLGDCKTHTALIVADTDTPWNHVSQARDLCLELFQSVHLTSLDEHVEGWIPGSNALFRHAAKWVQERLPEPWFWCEPDLVPLKTGWLNAIEGQYHRAGQPFMGCIVECDQPKLPRQHMNGCGVYPPDCWQRVCVGTAWTNAFDVAIAGQVVPACHNTRLIQSFYGQLNLGPTFAREKTPESPVNTFTLANLWPEAVTFHRCKDGTLIDMLRQDLYANEQNDLVVVFPFFNGDGYMALKNMMWIRSLNENYGHDIVLSYEHGTGLSIVGQIKEHALRCFRRVIEHRYAKPPRHLIGPNWAFKRTAEFMCRTIKRPWLWMEFDAIPLKSDWVIVLEREYRRHGKPFFGPIVAGQGHMNGTGIYPPNAVEYIPRTMDNNDTAGWDAQMKDEMIVHCADASRYYQHGWGVVNNRIHQTQGSAPSFPNMDCFRRWVNPNAVIFHRCKDGTLIDRLMERT